MISLLYARFEDQGAPSVAPLISPRETVELQRLLVQKSENPLDAFDGICVSLGNKSRISLSLFSEKKLTD